MLRMAIGCLLAVLIGGTEFVAAQGVLLTDQDHRLPRLHGRHHQMTRPVSSYRIKSLEINSTINDQLAVTQVSQTFINTGKTQIEASFVFPLPYEGAVDSMTFLVDGKEYEAKLLPAKKAREIYEGYIRRNQDPALLEWVGLGMFKTSVFPIPPGAERTVQITYTQLIRQDMGVNDYLIPLSTAKFSQQPLDTFSLRCVLNTHQSLKTVYSPSHGDLDIERPSDTMAVIKLERQQYTPGSDIRILYSEDDRSLTANLLSHWSEEDTQGFFTLLVSPDIQSPENQKPTPKTVLFVVDRSGSMNGKKIEQARQAAKFILNNLREGDLFNVVTYASDVQSYAPELQIFDAQTRKSALAFVEGIFAGGGTNINSALGEAFHMLNAESGPTYVLFLTDGLATQGVTNEMKIAANARKNNRNDARLISFGVGYDVNSRLLDRMTRENHGTSQYVRPDEDLEEHVSSLYAKIAAPVLTDVSVTFIDKGTEVQDTTNRIYPSRDLDLFAGQQLVLVGRYRQSGDAQLRISGKLGGQQQEFEYPVKFQPKSNNSRNIFCAKLWAARRIGEIIDLIDLDGKNPELINELVLLSTEHGIVTPYTSYLADDLAKPGDLANNQLSIERAGEKLGMLADESGRSGFAQRGYKSSLKQTQSTSTTPLESFAENAAPAAAGAGGGRGVILSATDSPKNLSKALPVRGAGKFTAYLKGNILFASNATDVDPEKDASKIIAIKKFSPEYFELIQTTTAAENQLLALQEPEEEMIVRIQGKIYRLK
ncbi:MAG: VIT and VWA domain-containing protein [Pirellulaceae bacterium]|nr:VIT and VWA domain-containing protein [Pirellulaceae bacterium]